MAARLENPYDVLDQADEDLDALASAKAAQAGKRKGAAAASSASTPAKAKETQPQGACNEALSTAAGGEQESTDRGVHEIMRCEPSRK